MPDVVRGFAVSTEYLAQGILKGRRRFRPYLALWLLNPYAWYAPLSRLAGCDQGSASNDPFPCGDSISKQVVLAKGYDQGL